MVDALHKDRSIQRVEDRQKSEVPDSELVLV
jgi:hypothetical protein